MRRALATLGIAAAALPLAACGRDEGNPIPRAKADALVRVLGTAQRQAENGSCQTLLRDTIPSLKRRAEALDSGVGSDVRQTITDGIDRLEQLATDACAKPAQPTTTDTTQSTSESTPSTTDTGTDTSNTDTNTDTSNTDTGTTGTGTTGTGTTDTGTTDTGTTDTGNGGTPPGTPRDEVPQP
jgi:hypothetical protein